MLLADGSRGLLFFDRCLVYHLSIEERSAVKSVYVMQVGFVVFTMFSTSANAQYIDLLENRSLHHWMTPAGENVEKGWACDPDGTLHLQGHGEILSLAKSLVTLNSVRISYCRRGQQRYQISREELWEQFVGLRISGVR